MCSPNPNSGCTTDSSYLRPVVYIYYVVVTVRHGVVARSSPFIELLSANDVTGSLGVRVPVPYLFPADLFSDDLLVNCFDSG